MDNNTISDPTSDQVKRKLPNAQLVFILGIASIIIGVICVCCYGGFVGWIIGLVGVIMGNKAIKEYKANPNAYTPQSFKQAKNGRLMCMISLIIGILFIILVLLDTTASAEMAGYITGFIKGLIEG
jgi:hypothetical protein